MASVEEPEQTSSKPFVESDKAYTRYLVCILLRDAHDFTQWWFNPFNLVGNLLGSSDE